LQRRERYAHNGIEACANATMPMRKTALYSRSSRSSADARAGLQAGDSGAGAASTPWRARLRAHIVAARVPIVCIACALVAAALTTFAITRPPPRALTQQDIDAAVLHTLDTHALPSMAQRAYEAVRPSVVHVRGLRHVHADSKSGSAQTAKGPLAPGNGLPHAGNGLPHAGNGSPHAKKGRPQLAKGTPPAAKPGEHPRPEADGPDDLYRIGIGTGVVIVSTGVILTNLHVIDGADAIEVTFADGTESPADVVSTQPENDLAVLKARIVPDDLPAATLRSTADLSVGDEVVAVGFPFGIGPSASSGIVSGLRREYRSEGNRVLTNLIQFDAAANPGNSGGPLVTADGEVVGIVTGIFNPTDQRVFIGIGFAVPIENAASAVGLSPF
jgi:serine protease DegQ